MTDHSRRDVLAVAGTVLGGIAVGSGAVTATTSDDRFIVKAAVDDVAGTDLTIVHDLHQIGYVAVTGDETTAKSITTEYGRDVTFDFDRAVERLDHGGDATDEPLYGLQWDKQATNVPDAQTVTRGEGTRVAIIDSGITAAHPDLEHAVNTDLGRNFTSDGLGANGPYGGYHGTHCAGIVAANDRNDTGVVGTAPGTELVDCRVFSEVTEHSGSFASVVAAILYATEIGSDVANLSLGAYPVPRQGQGQFLGGVLNAVTNYARNNGTLLTVAAGNDATDLQHDGSVISVPNESAGSMSISATGPIGFQWGADGLEQPASTPAKYTNYGTNAIDVAAPGGNYDPEFPTGWHYDLVLNAIGEYTEWQGDTPVETSLDTGYSWVAGTSMAAPSVAGAAALVKAENPNYDAHEVRSVIENTADNVGSNEYYGKGFLDVAGAVND